MFDIGFSAQAVFGTAPVPPRLYESLLEDPTAFGLSAALASALADCGHCEEDEGQEDEDAEEQGEHHDAHVDAYRAHKDREAHLAALHGGVATIWHHLDGSPGCTKLGCDEDFLHVHHLWADEADILATPFEPSDRSPFPPATGYPHCTMPWGWWPPVVGGGRSALLFIFRIWRAHRMVTAQIAAAGGLDDDRGWITRPGMPGFSDLAAWRRSIFRTDAEKKAARTVEKQEKKITTQRVKRAAVHAAEPPKVREVRAIEVVGDRAYVPLSQGYRAAINAADVPLVEGHNWYVAIVKGKRPFAKRAEQRPGGGTRNIRLNRVEGLTGPVEIIAPS